MASGADTLITCGGMQSNHARVTAAAGAALGLDVVLVLNGAQQDLPTGNARLDQLFGARVHPVASREDRDPTMAKVAAELTAAGRRPYVVPLGASTPAGALGFARSLSEITTAGDQARRHRPLDIVRRHAGGHRRRVRVVRAARARRLASAPTSRSRSSSPWSARSSTGWRSGSAREPASLTGDQPIEIDDRFVGTGYGVPTPASIEATELLARREGIVLDPVYTAKAMAGLIARVRAGDFTPTQKVLFWHTGGIPGYFA